MNTFSKILAVIIDFYLVACIVIVTLIILAIALLGAEFEISISFPTLKRLLQLFS